MRYLLLVISVFLISCGNDVKKETISEENTLTTHYYLIRHAEKDRTTNEDPSLTEIGEKRATHWATHFSDISFDAVYSTNYNRTKQTAAPTAKKMNVEIQLYDPANLFDEAFQKETAGKTVLVVGHSNTTPAFVNTIIGVQKYQQISDTENGMLFHVALHEDGTHQVDVTTVAFN